MSKIIIKEIVPFLEKAIYQQYVKWIQVTFFSFPFVAYWYEKYIFLKFSSLSTFDIAGDITFLSLFFIYKDFTVFASRSNEETNTISLNLMRQKWSKHEYLISQEYKSRYLRKCSKKENTMMKKWPEIWWIQNLSSKYLLFRAKTEGFLFILLFS